MAFLPTSAECERACARLAQAFVVYLDEARYEAVAELFLPDGVLHRVSGDILEGRDQIAQGLRRPAGQIVIHHASPVLVERVAEDEATGLSSFLAFAAMPETPAAVTQVAALWRDSYRLVDGRWRIARRVAEVRLHAPPL